MRPWWNVPLLGMALWAPLAVAEETTAPDQPSPSQASQPTEAAQDDDFQPRRPLGAFQPTDVGDPAAPNAGPMPPEQLAPELDAAPLRTLGEEPPAAAQPNEPPAQTVAPAQFQAPVQPANAPAAVAEPKTTIVPGAATPALQPVAPQTPPAADQPEPQNLAQSLYQQAISPPMTGAIAGAPLSLRAALTRRTDPTRYGEFVGAYWKLSQSLAAYHEALQGSVELSRLPQARLPHQQALLQAATTAAEVEVRQARLHALSAQWDLAERMTGEVAAPLPEDLPLLSAYRSKFEAVFASRVPPAGARRLHETFDARLALLEGRAAAVVASENAFAALADAYGQGQLDLSDVLREHARLHAARREFLRSVYDYNAAIADYAYLAAGPHRSPEIIVSMLVERPKPVTQQAAPANFVSP